MPHISTYHTIYINDEAFYPDDDEKLFSEEGESKIVTNFRCEGDSSLIELEGEEEVECVGVKGE